jgi:hypothetical protein
MKRVAENAVIPIVRRAFRLAVALFGGSTGTRADCCDSQVRPRLRRGHPVLKQGRRQ